jgi:hypothetical protein
VWRIGAVTAFLALSLPFLIFGGGERSAYIRTFSSYPASQAGFGLFGYSYGLGDQAVMAENAYYFDQIQTNGGAASKFSLYFTSVRPLYAFAASLIAPAVGVIAALATVNYLSWALAAAVAWRFTWLRAHDRRAAFLAVWMVASGLGAAIHIHDYSPHLFPFAIYYLGVLIVFESRVWAEARPLLTHVRVGAFLALASLSYSIGLVLAGAYVLVAVWRNRWWHVAVAAVMGLTSQYVWTIWLNIVQSIAVERWTWTNVQGIEQVYMMQSLKDWMALMATPSRFAARVLEGILQFSNFEVLPLIVAGVICWIVVRRSLAERWFDAVFVAAPFGAGLVYLNRSTTRGYLVYGVSLLLYATLAQAFSQALHNVRRPARVLAGSAIGLLLFMQLTWSSSYLWGYLVPAKIFFGFGYRDWMPLYLTQFQPPPAVSLTGAEPTPVLFGGSSTLVEAGLFVDAPPPPVGYSPIFALIYKLPIIAYLCAAAMLAATTSRRRIGLVLALAGFVWLISSVLPMWRPPYLPPVFPTFTSLHLPAGDSWRYSIEISESFVERLRNETRGSSIQFMVPGLHPPYTTTIQTGDGVIVASESDGRATLLANRPTPEIIERLGTTRRLEIEITARPEGQSPAAGVSIFGWQRARLPHRQLSDAKTGQSLSRPTLPAFEMRLLDANAKLLLIGF